VGAPKPDTTKKPRRRLTDEERIAAREAEIAAIKANQRKRALDSIAEARESLELAVELAEKCGMNEEAKKWGAALIALGEDEVGL
jgi:hypothetical protein